LRAPAIHKPKLRGMLAEAKGMSDPIDLSPLWQLEDPLQYQTLVSHVLGALEGFEGRPVGELVRGLSQRLSGGRHSSPTVAEVRPVDVAFVVNRVPGLRVERQAP